MLKNKGLEIGSYQVRTYSIDEGDCILDINKYLVTSPESTFFLNFQGNSMGGIGIFKSDIMVVDRSRAVEYGNLVVVVLEGVLRVGRLVKRGDRSLFKSASGGCSLFEVEGLEGVEIWGTVTSVIHKL